MYPFVTLTDGVISLRPYDFGDVPALHQAVKESLAELSPWMSWATDKYSYDSSQNFVTLSRAEWANGRIYNFVICDAHTGEFLGGSGLSFIHPVYHFCNLGYWIRSSCHGHGFAGRAAMLVGKFAFEKVKLIRAEIVIAKENHASKRVAEKIGAHYEGILLNRMVVGKSIYDAHMFSLLPSDFGLSAKL